MTEKIPARKPADIGVVGMAVMGSNIARNFARRGFVTAIYNRTEARTQAVIAAHGHEGAFVPARTLPEFVASLARPRRILLMVQAGSGTDQTIDAITPLLEQGDILIDGGNSFYEDTRARETRLRALGIHFVGAGISGGEVGALEGPAIMVGGSSIAYETLGPILERASAQAAGEPCCAHVGPDGAGHFVKMVHNGIEYADMQLIGEAFEVLKSGGLTTAECAQVFEDWNRTDLDSYLIEITAEVLRQLDAKTGKPLVDQIVDAAGMKGTGTWTVQTALKLGIPVDSIAASVFARATSSHSHLRRIAQVSLTGPRDAIEVQDRGEFIENVRQSLWASKVIAYAQGLDLIREASIEYGWEVEIGVVAKIWRAGCIIRARLLDRIHNEYATESLATLLEAKSVAEDLAKAQTPWRSVVIGAVKAGLPVPGFSSALAYYDSIRAPRLNAALTQGMRDYFGAHTYRRIDSDGAFHTLWSSDQTEVAV